jgi:hypothetical protein
MDDWESEFAKASQYVERGESMVARQREQVERLRAIGAATQNDEDALALYEVTLAGLVDYRQLVLDKAKMDRKFLLVE